MQSMKAATTHLAISQLNYMFCILQWEREGSVGQNYRPLVSLLQMKPEISASNAQHLKETMYMVHDCTV